MNVEISVPFYVQGTTLAEVRAAFARYPALANLEVAVDSAGNVFWSHNEGRCFLIVKTIDGLHERSDYGSWDLAGTQYYRRSPVLLPRAAKDNAALHPLLAWWLVLFALSMLARYAPGQWTDALSINKNPLASRIELLLDAALEAVPELLKEALTGLER